MSNQREKDVSLDEMTEKSVGRVKDVDVKREDARLFISIMIIAPLPLTFVLAFLYIWCHSGQIEVVRQLVDMLLTPLIGLVGAVTGFYFSDKKSSGSGDT